MTESDGTEQLSFEQEGEDFFLVRIDQNGNKSELFLSAANVTFLNRLLPLTIQKILARYSSPAMIEQGIATSLYVPVVRLRSAPDLHQEAVLMDLTDQYDNKTSYALPLEIAKPLAGRLHDLATEIEQAAAARKLQ